MRPEYLADRGRLRQVVGQRGRAVGVDVPDLLRRQLRAAQRRPHGPRGPIDGWLRNVACIGAHAESHQFRVDPRAARLRRFQRFQHEHGAAFTKDHAAAILGKWTARLRRHHAHRLPGLQNTHAERGFATPRDSQVAAPGGDHLKRLPDGMRRRRARRRNRVGWPGDAELHRNVAGPRVGHRLGDGQRVYPIGPLLINFHEPGVFGGLPAHARPRDDRRSLAQFRRPLHSGVFHGLARGNHRELREAVHEVRAPVVEVRLVSVVLDLGAVLKTQARGVGGFNLPDAAAPFAQRLGEFGGIAAQRTDGACAGDHDASHRLIAGWRVRAFCGHQPFHAGTHIADVAHAAHFLVGNADIELALEGEQDLYGVHRIDSQLHELAIDGHGFDGNALGGGNHLRHALDQVFGHMSRPIVSNL